MTHLDGECERAFKACDRLIQSVELHAIIARNSIRASVEKTFWVIRGSFLRYDAEHEAELTYCPAPEPIPTADAHI